jgi:hypothetical protein
MVSLCIYSKLRMVKVLGFAHFEGCFSFIVKWVFVIPHVRKSEGFIPGTSGRLDLHRMSLRFLGRDIAILMSLKLSCPLRELLYIFRSVFFVISFGWYTQ